jgi:AP-1 complex subunit sigma 1/2
VSSLALECAHGGGARFPSLVASRRLVVRGGMIHFALLFSRQGKVRLSKYYKPYSQKERAKLVKEVTSQILSRPSKLCNVVEHRNLKLIYKRYASLYFLLAVDDDENELVALEMIQHYVEILDRYFGNVCELDLIFNFHKAYFILDEVLVAGELQETSKKLIARLVSEQDALVEAAKLGHVEEDGTPLRDP